VDRITISIILIINVKGIIMAKGGRQTRLTKEIVYERLKKTMEIANENVAPHGILLKSILDCVISSTLITAMKKTCLRKVDNRWQWDSRKVLSMSLAEKILKINREICLKTYDKQKKLRVARSEKNKGLKINQLDMFDTIKVEPIKEDPAEKALAKINDLIDQLQAEDPNEAEYARRHNVVMRELKNVVGDIHNIKSHLFDLSAAIKITLEMQAKNASMLTGLCETLMGGLDKEDQ
jgi:hypothetical protein